MKIRITFKTPDAVDEAIEEAVGNTLPVGIPEDEQKAIADLRVEKVKAASRKWFEWGECATVEWDTDANTCTVVPCK